MVYNHILGTCALGRVVDERLRVKGVRGLRVVDASVIPASLSGNIMSTVYALAEKAADMIKEDRIVYG
jgi:choline dehydrogenase-like flavoprotein